LNLAWLQIPPASIYEHDLPRAGLQNPRGGNQDVFAHRNFERHVDEHSRHQL
jgi:hypothetical protein